MGILIIINKVLFYNTAIWVCNIDTHIMSLYGERGIQYLRRYVLSRDESNSLMFKKSKTEVRCLVWILNVNQVLKKYQTFRNAKKKVLNSLINQNLKIVFLKQKKSSTSNVSYKKCSRYLFLKLYFFYFIDGKYTDI